TFEEMLEMASQGSKVLQIRSVEFAGKYKVPLRVLSSFVDGPGTLISLEENASMENPIVSGIAFNRDEAKVSIFNVPDQPGIASKILGAVAQANIEVDVIVQNTAHDDSNDFSFTIHRNDLKKTVSVLERIQDEIGFSGIETDDKIVKVSLVGVGMRSHAGVAAKMFDALASDGINIQMITTSEIKITVIIEEKYLELAVRGIHSAFDLDQKVE
ncbi:MAG: aspartate kinase, partial [Pseudomonadales bacterium]